MSYNNNNDDVTQSDPLAPVTIEEFSNKHYLVFLADINASNYVRLYWSIYFLKDI